MPLDPKTPPGRKPRHRAFASVAGVARPFRFRGFCVAGDFVADVDRDNEKDAKADVKAHLDSVH